MTRLMVEAVDPGILLASAEVLAAPDKKPVHVTEAPAGFDGNSNGLVNHRTFADDRAVFDEFEDIKDGLGPLSNMPSHAGNAVRILFPARAVRLPSCEWGIRICGNQRSIAAR